ncbi:MAG TPA: hypothetical protein VIJ15_02930 [Dermatophilaceae bacterium]
MSPTTGSVLSHRARTPVATTTPTSPASNAPDATEAARDTTEIASPADHSSAPAKHNRAKDKAGSPDDQEDGKQ